MKYTKWKSTNAIKSFLGALVLILISQAVIAKDWKSAELITHDEFLYGAFEARIRVAEGSGMITAYFLWKHDSELSYTEWQEQDFEMFGKDGNYQTQIMTPGNPRTENAANHKLPTKAYDDYYTYRMEWTPEYIAFYVDGHLIRRETDRTKFDKHLNRGEASQIRLSLWAADSEWSGAFDPGSAPAATYVEYFEAYEYTPGTGSNGSDFSLLWRDDFDFIDYNNWWFANWTFSHAVNDYIADNAASIDGKLVLALTHESEQGEFPSNIPSDQGPVVWPGDEPRGEIEGEVTFPDAVAVTLPARIEAEDFTSYSDSTLGNNGYTVCTRGDVDLEVTKDVDGNCNIGWTTPGETVSYLVDAPADGDYTLSLRAGTGSGSGVKSVTILVDNVVATTPVVVEAKGWSVFSDIETVIPLSEGEQKITVEFTTGSVNLNYLAITQNDVEEVEPPTPLPEPEPEPEPPTPPVAPNSSCSYVVINEWNSGFVAEIRITNTGNQAINDWNVSWSYSDGSQMTSSWNAVVSGTSTYSATPLSWNANIRVGDTVVFGVQGNKGSASATTPIINGAVCN